MGRKPDIETDGETFESAFHAFMHECMQRKNLDGQDRATVQAELVSCARAWESRRAARTPQDIDEESLADAFLEGTEGRPTGAT